MLISIALRIVGDFLEPEEISVILGVSPHVAWRKGEVRITSSKKRNCFKARSVGMGQRRPIPYPNN